MKRSRATGRFSGPLPLLLCGDHSPSPYQNPFNLAIYHPTGVEGTWQARTSTPSIFSQLSDFSQTGTARPKTRKHLPFILTTDARHNSLRTWAILDITYLTRSVLWTAWSVNSRLLTLSTVLGGHTRSEARPEVSLPATTERLRRDLTALSSW